MCLGISFKVSASVEVMIRFLSIEIPGSVPGFEPVAMIVLPG